VNLPARHISVNSGIRNCAGGPLLAAPQPRPEAVIHYGRAILVEMTPDFAPIFCAPTFYTGILNFRTWIVGLLAHDPSLNLKVAIDWQFAYLNAQSEPKTQGINVFSGFNQSLLDDPDFKEDSVREIIITPLLTRLGYSPSGPNRIVRSKSLKHPFIYAGTRKCPVTLIPDYTLIHDEKALLVLDAKRPTEDILKRANVQQGL